MTTAETHRHEEHATKADLTALEERIDHRFELVDQRFDAVDQRFDAIDQRFNDQNRHFQTQFDGLIARIESVSTFLNRVVLAMFGVMGAAIVTLLIQIID